MTFVFCIADTVAEQIFDHERKSNHVEALIPQLNIRASGTPSRSPPLTEPPTPRLPTRPSGVLAT